MTVLRQIFAALAVLAVTLAVWVVYVPGARPWLEKAGLGGIYALVPAADAASETAPSGAAAPPDSAIRVVARPIVRVVEHDTATAIGNGRALHSVTVMPQVAGLLVAVNFTAGGHVTKGDLLAQLDDEAQKIAVAKAQLVLDDAREKAARLTKLGRSGTASNTQISDAELTVRTAELALRQARFDVAQRRVVAPISGWVGLRSAEVGDQVTTSTALGQIDDRSTLLVDFRLPERYVGRLHKGMTLEVSPLAQPDLRLTGVVDALDNRVDQASRTILVQARLDNTDDNLRPGMAFAIRARFTGAKVPAVPPLAIQWSDRGAYVWVARKGRAEQVPVRLRQRADDRVLVSAPFQPGDLVVTEGVQMLQPGARVAVQPDDPHEPGNP